MKQPLVVGSLVTSTGIRPFTLYLPGGEPALNAYEPQATGQDFTPGELHELERQLRQAVDFAIDEVRIGEYFCRVCGQWVEATHARWSLTICLSCSLDRGSELAEYYETR